MGKKVNLNVESGDSAKKQSSTVTAKFKLGDLYDGVINDITSFSRMTLPGSLSFRFARFLNKINAEYRSAEETRVKIVEACKVTAEDGSVFVPMKGRPGWVDSDEFREKEARWTREWEALKAEEFSVEFEPIRADEISNIQIQPAVLATLMEFNIVVEG